MYFEEGVIIINNKNILENTTSDNNRFKAKQIKRIRKLNINYLRKTTPSTIINSYALTKLPDLMGKVVRIRELNHPGSSIYLHNCMTKESIKASINRLLSIPNAGIFCIRVLIKKGRSNEHESENSLRCIDLDSDARDCFLCRCKQAQYHCFSSR